MKKWIFVLIALTLLANANAVFLEAEGAQQNTNQGFFAAVKAFFSVAGCLPSWAPQYGVCALNDTMLKTYTDLSGCSTTTGLPSDNGTGVSCNYCSYNLVYSEVSFCHGKTNESKNVTVFDSNFIACCNITGLNSDCYRNDSVAANYTHRETILCTNSKMYEVAIAILLIGGMFFLIYVANSFNDRNDKNEVVPLISFVKMILYGLAMLTAFIGVQTTLGISIEGGLGDVIQKNLEALYKSNLWFFFLIGAILLLGLLANYLYKAYYYIGTVLKFRKMRK